ncbi:MotE family protein [Paenibacillus zeisoli]|uniref:MotE family protein n=1 Tax=Paenibacillus zeisoli TaxID=2496267 RepID=UPI00319D8D65
MIIEEEEKESGGKGFARFLFIVTPILFTVVLVGVLLTLFNVNFKNEFLKIGNNIPIVKDWLPDPAASTKQAESSEATIKGLKDQVSEQDANLKKANEAAKAQADKVKELQAKLDEANKAVSDQKSQDAVKQESDYQKEVKKLANLYGSMNPGKAAAILGNLTTEETVQMLNAMSNESKAAILEKMDPKKAADVSILLKDAKPSEDMAIAALQSRLNKGATTTPAATSSSTGLSDQEIGQTFAAMTPENAAKLLLETNKTSPDKTLKILKSVDDTSRSEILSAMNDKEPATAAKILNKMLSK